MPAQCVRHTASHAVPSTTPGLIQTQQRRHSTAPAKGRASCRPRDSWLGSVSARPGLMACLDLTDEASDGTTQAELTAVEQRLATVRASQKQRCSAAASHYPVRRREL